MDAITNTNHSLLSLAIILSTTMPNPFSAFPLLGDRLPQYCKALVNLPPCEFWIHETKLAELLKLPQGPEHGPSDVLTTILACMKRGNGGNKRAKTIVSTTYDAVDFADSKNKLGIYVQEWGRQESFIRGTLTEGTTSRRPRWLIFGNICQIEVNSYGVI